MTRHFRLLLLALPLLSCGAPTSLNASTPAEGDEVVVSAAASLADAMTAVAQMYQRETGMRVVLNVGPSSGLARQIINGAPVDVFVSADETQMDTVAAAGRVDASRRLDLLGNQLVIIMPAGAREIASAKALTAPPIRRIALADPAAVPAGVYARQYLESVNLWTALTSKIVPTLDVRAALAAVDSGNVDAAFVYRTDAAIAHRAVIVFVVPAAGGPRIVYPAAVLDTAPHRAAARAFFAFLTGSRAQAAFEQFGFTAANHDR